jgi:chemotaxis protein CheD
MPSDPEAREVFLNPGDYAFGDDQVRMRTILGSCVAVTFWHPRLRTGAMCHYLLPARAPSQTEPSGGKYAEEVIPLIAARFRDRGLPAQAFQVKMFGGSNMFPGLTLGETLNIGAKNIQVGLASLTRCGFNILNYDLAGGTNRMIVFDLWSGEVWVRQGQGTTQDPGPMNGDGRRQP